MRKLTLITAAAGTALAFAAAPASAQYAPQYQPQYRPAPQGNAYGYSNYGQNNDGQFRAMQARIDGIQRQVEHLRQRRMITRREADGLRSESRQIEWRLRQVARYGLNPNEARQIDHRITRLERHVAREVRDGRGYAWDNRNNGDRDRDGRNDRYEDDRGTRRD